MRNRRLLIIAWFLMVPMTVMAADSPRAEILAGQDLHLTGGALVNYQPSGREHILLFGSGFTMSIGANHFSSDSAVVWLDVDSREVGERVDTDYNVRVYLKGNVSVRRGSGAKTTDISESVVENGDSLVVRFSVSGEVFVTAQKRETADPRELNLYKEAISKAAPLGPDFKIQPGAVVPQIKPDEAAAATALPPQAAPQEGEVKAAAPETVAPAAAEEQAKAAEPIFRYPINISPAGKEPLKIQWQRQADGNDVATLTERFYLWQKQDEEGAMLELQADNAVVFSQGDAEQNEEITVAGDSAENAITKGRLTAIYVCGDVIMTEGARTIRADEIFYDFEQKKALVVNAVLRTFDAERGIPIYIRAEKLRQLAANKFSGENIVLTSSEFYMPQLSMTASSVIITDTTAVDQQADSLTDNSFQVEMKDVRLKAGETTIFRWPGMKSDMQRPDMPLKGLHLGQDNTYGSSVETQWYLARLLGLSEDDGTESSLNLDYYGKRGPGAGFEVEYDKGDYFGRMLGYIVDDHGEDRLGREDFRRNLEPPNELRGRFNWMHRQFLPDKWQLTTGIGYSSDENFIESYYRSDYATEQDQTYIHLKRIEDNWALSFLGRARINDFRDELEELPSVEHHLTGQSLFDDRFTLYADTELGRLRQRIGDDHTIAMNEESFTYGAHRSELDMPFQAGDFKFVPFVAGTFGYDDRSGFTRSLVDGSNSGSLDRNDAWIGEGGVRISPNSIWKVYPDVKSRLWDINQLKHIISPQLTAVAYAENDNVAEQRDVLNFGLSQRLQTKRGSGEKQRTIDWMRLDTDFTFVNDSDEAHDTGADRFIWNRTMIPMEVMAAPEIFNGDFPASLQRFENWGPRRNYFGADYIWRVTDTTAILSDLYYDMQSGVVQQYNFGFSRLRWPNLGYYIGSRYLRRTDILEEKGSNIFIFSATYKIDPRYTLVFSQQYDFDYGASVRSDIALIRQYHRMYCGITYSADQSLDRQAVVISLWPQGVPELAIGQRRYMNLGGVGEY